MKELSLLNLSPLHHTDVVQFLPNSSTVSQMHTFCGDIDACKYDLKKTKNLTLAAASKHFNVKAVQRTRRSLTDTGEFGKAVKQNLSHINNYYCISSYGNAQCVLTRFDTVSHSVLSSE